MRIASLLLLFAVIDAKKKNPWKKTVGQPKSTPRKWKKKFLKFIANLSLNTL